MTTSPPRRLAGGFKQKGDHHGKNTFQENRNRATYFYYSIPGENHLI